ncbi:hypothetical protein H2203_003370 [Taxawa tesnikishii (nom. ined.)]|nr:hypothetical protein H2203_003370 [Dothideales sp. JES 119]
MEPPIEKLAQQWLELDQDPETSREMESLLASRDTAELELRLRKRITFGTAGLRASMGAGFSRMNALTVIQASQGLAAYLLEQEPSARDRGVVIGRDARYNSDKFAKLAAAAFIHRGIRILWLGMVHTPLVPFTVGKLNAAAGVMVTASHNPANDNGYKVYWSNGCQIIPPHDVGIAEAIERNLGPQSWDSDAVARGSPLVVHALDQVKDAYFAAISSIASPSTLKISPDPTPFVYTPMHGVGLPFFTTAVQQLGVLPSSYHVVEEQAHPDPSFPTVRFPNPEEKGALKLATSTADTHDISLVLANDPDADRFSIAQKVGGEWRQLTGNQIGILLGSYVAESYLEGLNANKKPLAMLASTVSSRMLSALAKHNGFHFEETLTGFKWMGNRARDLESRGYAALYAFEEAIGYMFSPVVFDKDGVTAASQLYEQYGYFEDANTYLVSPSPATTNAVFDGIRQSMKTGVGKYVGRRRIMRWRDLTVGYDSATPDSRPALPVDSNAQMISCELEGGVCFTVRGSGTEPKIKLYIEGESKESSAAAKAKAEEVLESLLSEWFKPDENGLRLA